jgi:hypothetical protein
MMLKSSRRQLVARTALAAPVAGLLAMHASAAAAGGDGSHDGLAAVLAPANATPTAAAAAPTSVPGSVGEVAAPDWRFTVTQFHDPYQGAVSRPATPDPDTRYVGAEVTISNGSDQPLSFSTSDVRLKDKTGFEYTAGSVLGEEPKLVSQNLPDGERTRGWVWFMVPKDATFSELRFIGPSPIFRVTLPGS